MNKLAFSLAVPSFVFTFNSRKSQQKLILNTKSTSKRRKLKYLFKSKLNQFLLSPLLASNCYTMYQKQHFCVELYSDISKNIPYLPANIDLKKEYRQPKFYHHYYQIMLIIFVFFLGFVFFKKRACCMLKFFSTELLFKMKL